MPEIEFEANGGTAEGYLAEPEGEGPGVVVLQEWWGLVDQIQGVCDRFAAEGFVALAPDLYHGETTDQPDEAQQKLMALNMDEAEKEMRGAVEFLPTTRSATARSARSASAWAAASRSGPRRPTRHRRRGQLLLRDAARQARLLADRRPGPGPLRHRRRLHPGRGREGARAGDPRGRQRRQVPLLRGRRPRVLQRGGPDRHPPPRARQERLGAHRRLLQAAPRARVSRVEAADRRR